MPFAAENALDKIRTLYWPLGYNDVRSDYSLVLDRGIGVVDVTFTIKEGAQSIVGPIQVRGTQRLDERLVRQQIELVPGEPLDLSALAKSRRNLYDTGAFSTVQINQGDRREENRRASADAAASNGPQTSEQSAPAQPSEPIAQAENQPPNGQKPVPLNVVVREVQPLQHRTQVGACAQHSEGNGEQQWREEWDPITERARSHDDEPDEQPEEVNPGLAEVRVGENETFESALRRFNKKIQQSGILAEARRREHYEKPSVKRKRKEAKRKKNARTQAG